MRYLDSIFVDESVDERIKARAKVLHTRGRVTFADAMVAIITAGLDALDAEPEPAPQQAPVESAPVDQPGLSEVLTSAPDPLAAMTGS